MLPEEICLLRASDTASCPSCEGVAVHQAYETCETCGGKGLDPDKPTTECDFCRGSGEKPQSARSKLHCGLIAKARNVNPHYIKSIVEAQAAAEMTPCLDCKGQGWFANRCRACHGDGRRLVESQLVRSQTCRFCEGAGHIPIARYIASRAPVEYVHRIARAVAGPPEDDDLVLQERVARLSEVLAEVRQYAKQDCPDRLPELFPEDVI
jgi:DnaJ-class molecular chaperone